MIGMSYLERFPTWSEILKPQVQVQGETMDVLVRMLAKERDINRKKARDVRIAFVLLFAGLIFMASESIVLVARQAFP
jgi:hypothetical protein